MKYPSVTLVTRVFVFMVLFTTVSAEAWQRQPEVSHAQTCEQANTKRTLAARTATAQDREVLSKLLEGVFDSLRDRDYARLVSFYSEEAQANFKYRFANGEANTKLRQAIPELPGNLNTLLPGKFMATVYAYLLDKLTPSGDKTIDVFHPSITNIEISAAGNEAVLTFVDSDPGMIKQDTNPEKTMGFVKISGIWIPLGCFIEEMLDEIVNLLLLQTFAPNSHLAGS